jgi:hypothetical protein
MAKIGSLVTGHKGLKVSIGRRNSIELKGNWGRKHGSEVSAFPDEIP